MDDQDWELVSKVRRSTYRKRALTFLYEVGEPRTPKEIANQFDVRRNHISRALAELKDEQNPLVEIINPDAPYDRRYRITEYGKMIIEKMQEITDE